MTRRRQNLDQFGRNAFTAIAQRLSHNGLTGQREGHEVALTVLLGHAVAARAHFEDIERDGHARCYPSQLLAGRISPTSRPTTFLIGGCSSSSFWSAGNTPR